MLSQIMGKGVVSMESAKKLFDAKSSLEIDMALESEIAMHIFVLNTRLGARSCTSQSQKTGEENPLKTKALNMCNINAGRPNDT